MGLISAMHQVDIFFFSYCTRGYELEVYPRPEVVCWVSLLPFATLKFTILVFIFVCTFIQPAFSWERIRRDTFRVYIFLLFATKNLPGSGMACFCVFQVFFVIVYCPRSACIFIIFFILELLMICIFVPIFPTLSVLWLFCLFRKFSIFTPRSPRYRTSCRTSRLSSDPTATAHSPWRRAGSATVASWPIRLVTSRPAWRSGSGAARSSRWRWVDKGPSISYFLRFLLTTPVIFSARFYDFRLDAPSVTQRVLSYRKWNGDTRSVTLWTRTTLSSKSWTLPLGSDCFMVSQGSLWKISFVLLPSLVFEFIKELGCFFESILSHNADHSGDRVASLLSLLFYLWILHLLVRAHLTR